MIAPQTIASVKERTDLVALIGETVRLQRKGRTFQGLCPFHKEKTPSFHVNPERGIYHCFGCKESGSAIDFMMKIEGMSFTEAVRALAERSGVEVVDTATDAERREAVAARRAREDLYAVNHLAATFFEQSMRGTSAHPLAGYALDELRRRGLDPGPDAAGSVADALQAFRVGYAPPAWDGLVAYLKRQGVSPVAAEKVGLLVPRSSGSGYYDRFRHRLMFAVTDVQGRVIAFSGRSLAEPTADELRSLGLSPAAGAEVPAKYVNSPESTIYTKGEHLFGLYQARHAIRQKGEAILVEGNFDVLSLHARGVDNVVAPLGTAFTAAQAKLLKRFTPTVTLLFDGDAAGKKATWGARQPCKEGGLDARVGVLPPKMDPDDFVRTRGVDALKNVTKAAKELYEHLIDDALENDSFNDATTDGKLSRIHAVASLLGEQQDAVKRLMLKTYADRLSSKLVMGGQSPKDLRQLEQLLDQATRKAPQPVLRAAETQAPHHQARSRSRVDEIGLEILGALLDYPVLFDHGDVMDAVSALDGEAALAIGTARQCLTDEMEFRADEFLAQIPRSIHAFAAGRLASPVFETADMAREELLKNAGKLKKLSLLRENAEVAVQLQRVAPLGDVALEDALLLESARRARAKLGGR
ncbi:MAG: DNA primase [Polyangiaceae bacterium]|nr:DNA primase [Polyangiaceae bacterium]